MDQALNQKNRLYGSFWVAAEHAYEGGLARQLHICPDCGALVCDTAQHDEWHRTLSAVATGVVTGTVTRQAHGDI